MNFAHHLFNIVDPTKSHTSTKYKLEESSTLPHACLHVNPLLNTCHALLIHMVLLHIFHLSSWQQQQASPPS